MNHISYLKRTEIDLHRWNNLVSGSVNGLIYANTHYLDHLAGNWAALVLNDYQAVIPLTYKKKYGIRYLYQPAFCQQLGIIGDFTDNESRLILKKAAELFPFAEISLNYANQAHLPDSIDLTNDTHITILADPTYQSTARTTSNNYIIDLEAGYQKISEAFSGDLRKNLQRVKQFPFEYREGHDPKAAIHLYRHQYGKRFPHVTKNNYNALQEYASQFPGQVLIREVWHHNTMLAIVLCLADSKRIYFLLSTIMEEGRKLEANHFLIDQLVREFSGKPLILDFEGSDIQGIAAFYSGFGAVNQPYPRIKWNHLPWPWKLFKH